MNLPKYSGPKRSAVNAMADELVLLELERLGETPCTRPPHFYDTEDESIVTDALIPPLHWTAVRLAESERSHEKWYRDMLRSQLYTAYVRHWVTSLPIKSQWAFVEAYEPTAYKARKADDYSESYKRNTTKAELISRTVHAVTCILRKEEMNGPTTKQTRAPKPRPAKLCTEAAAEGEI